MSFRQMAINYILSEPKPSISATLKELWNFSKTIKVIKMFYDFIIAISELKDHLYRAISKNFKVRIRLARMSNPIQNKNFWVDLPLFD